MKLFYRLFGSLLAGMIILIGTDEYLSFTAEVEQFEKDMITNATQLGNSISGMIRHTWSESGEKKARELIDDAGASGDMAIRWVWWDDFAAILAEEEKSASSFQMNEQNKSISIKVANSSGEYRITYIPVELGLPAKGGLEMRQDLTPLHAFTSRMISRAVTITGMLALISGLILFFFMDRYIREPLVNLTARAKRIGNGDFSIDKNIRGNDELAEMAKTMNDMCSRLLIAQEKIKFEYDARLKTLEQLRHTEKLSSFGLISAGIAHELGTPLNVVDGRAKMILKEDLSMQEIKDCSSIIQNQAERMTIIIRQLLDFTRRPRQNIARENVALLVKQVIQLLHPMANKQQVSFVLHHAEETNTTLMIDGSQIQQILVNLLMNSVQAMPEGGKVDITLSNTESKYSSEDESQVKKYLHIRIADEGEGIRKEDLDHIFTPFFTTKTVGSGTGLGLSIAHGIVEEHGGWIEVESNYTNGACFSVFLPMNESRQ